MIDGLASVLFAAQVLANWNGAYLGKQKEAVEDFFKVELPEIDLKSKTAH